MLRFGNRKTPLIPHQLAAVAALMLLVTAWTGQPTHGPETDSFAARDRAAATAVGAVDANARGAQPALDVRSRSRSRISLMLFRFN